MPARPPKVSTGGMFLIELDRHRFLSLIPPHFFSRSRPEDAVQDHGRAVDSEDGGTGPDPIAT